MAEFLNDEIESFDPVRLGLDPNENLLCQRWNRDISRTHDLRVWNVEGSPSGGVFNVSGDQEARFGVSLVTVWAPANKWAIPKTGMGTYNASATIDPGSLI